MRSYIVEYARKEWSGWTKNNYIVMSAEDPDDLAKKFAEEHPEEQYRILRLIAWSGKTWKRYEKRFADPE